MSETLLRALRVPTAKYDAAQTTSHEYGWYSQPLVRSVSAPVLCLVLLIQLRAVLSRLEPSSIRRLARCLTDQGRFKAEGGGQGPPLVIILAPLWPPMKFMIKHNLPLVCGGSLWQYRFVHPQLQLWPPHFPPPNVNPRTATVTDPSSSRVIVCCHLRSADSKLQ